MFIVIFHGPTGMLCAHLDQQVCIFWASVCFKHQPVGLCVISQTYLDGVWCIIDALSRTPTTNHASYGIILFFHQLLDLWDILGCEHPSSAFHMQSYSKHTNSCIIPSYLVISLDWI